MALRRDASNTWFATKSVFALLLKYDVCSCPSSTPPTRASPYSSSPPCVYPVSWSQMTSIRFNAILFSFLSWTTCCSSKPPSSKNLDIRSISVLFNSHCDCSLANSIPGAAGAPVSPDIYLKSVFPLASLTKLIKFSCLLFTISAANNLFWCSSCTFSAVILSRFTVIVSLRSLYESVNISASSTPLCTCCFRRVFSDSDASKALSICSSLLLVVCHSACNEASSFGVPDSAAGSIIEYPPVDQSVFPSVTVLGVNFILRLACNSVFRKFNRFNSDRRFSLASL